MRHTISKSWPGETCVILAGGPSLVMQDLSALSIHRPKVITINDSWRLWPYADVFYFCDQEWYENQLDRNRLSLCQACHFRDLLVTGFWLKGGEELRSNPSFRHIPFTGQTGLETDPSGLRHGSNSSYAAINLAYHYGVRKIILLGVDMQVVDGRTHWHDEKRPGGFDRILRNTMLPLFDSLVEPLKSAGVEVINASSGSALTCWLTMALEQALQPVLETVKT